MAHILEESNGISAILHIPPDDKPVANEKTKLYFDLQSKDIRFKVEDCNCRVTISSNDKVIESSQQLKPRSTSDAAGEVTVTFPKVGVYDISLEGSSKNKAYSDFSLNYVERVTTTTEHNSSATKYLPTILILVSTVVILFVMAGYAIISKNRKNQE